MKHLFPGIPQCQLENVDLINCRVPNDIVLIYKLIEISCEGSLDNLGLFVTQRE